MIDVTNSSGLPEDSGSPRVPYNGPAQTDTSAPTAPNIQPDSQQQMISPVAPAQSQPTAPSVTAPPVAPSPNQRLHSFVSSVLGGITSSLAGKPATRYSTDSSGRTIADPNQPVDTRGNQVRRIVGNALEGLGAGAQAGGKKSGLADALSGIGAGAGAQRAQATEMDDKAKKEERENYEATQRKIMAQYQIAHTNALTFTTYAHDMREEDEHDPQRKKYSQWADAADEAGMQVQTMSAKEAQAAQKSDPTFAVNHLILPAGFKPSTGPNGEVLTDPTTGQPVRDGQVLVIAGGHNDATGKQVVSLPSSLVDDIHKYGDSLGIANAKSLNEGDEVSADQFFRLIGAAQEGNKKEKEGWLKPTITVDQASGKTFEKNTNTGETREAKAIPTADVKNISDANKKDTSGEVTPALKYREDREDNRAKMKNPDNSGPSSNLTGDEYLATLPTGRAAMVKAVGEGRQVLPANRKEALAILQDVHQTYGDWDESLGKTWPKTRNEYMGSGKTATQIVPAYNTALEHMQKLFDNTTSEGIFNPTSKAYQQRQVELGYVTREVGKAVSAGAMTQKESEDLLDQLNGGLTPGLRRERVTETAQLLHDKIDEYQNKFSQAAPSPAVHVPLLISPRAASSYDYLRSGGKTQQPSQQQQNHPVTGQSAMPPGATHIVPGPDGKNHYTNANGTVDYGVAQ